MEIRLQQKQTDIISKRKFSLFASWEAECIGAKPLGENNLSSPLNFHRFT